MLDVSGGRCVRRQAVDQLLGRIQPAVIRLWPCCPSTTPISVTFPLSVCRYRPESCRLLEACGAGIERELTGGPVERVDRMVSEQLTADPRQAGHSGTFSNGMSREVSHR